MGSFDTGTGDIGTSTPNTPPPSAPTGNSTFGGASTLDWAKLALAAYQDAEKKKKTGQFVQAPESPTQQAIRSTYLGFLQPGGSPTQGLVQPLVENVLHGYDGMGFHSPATVTAKGLPDGIGGVTAYGGANTDANHFDWDASAMGNASALSQQSHNTAAAAASTPEPKVYKETHKAKHRATGILKGALAGLVGGPVGAIVGGVSGGLADRNAEKQREKDSQAAHDTWAANQQPASTTDANAQKTIGAKAYVMAHPDVATFGFRYFNDSMTKLGLQPNEAYDVWQWWQQHQGGKP